MTGARLFLARNNDVTDGIPKTSDEMSSSNARKVMGLSKEQEKKR